MTNKTSPGCAKAILSFYAISIFLTFIVGMSDLISPYLYIKIFIPIFVSLLLYILYLGKRKVMKSLNDSVLFSFATIAMTKPIEDLLNKALTIDVTITDLDKFLLIFYLMISIFSIFKALIALTELYDNITNSEDKK
ncbi:hypothetical protein ACQ3G7_16770 [Kosakonia oryzendophytica]|uniref:hypothetical protein n=1 Tax=Kosakonia oryzendophytica TaxID=1005665 RepID=UPI0029E3E759|nr:hypothetical protein [Cronobacter sakazakii]